MAPRLVTDSQLVERLTGLFRQVGYDGASLGAIATATGLQKSSLYHRFPGGKQQMAAEASASVIQEFAGAVLAPVGSEAPLHERVAAIAANLDRFYDGGARYCLLDMLSVGDPGVDAASNLAAAAMAWISVFEPSLARRAPTRQRRGPEPRTPSRRSRAHSSSAGSPATGARSRAAIDGLAERLLGASRS